MKLTFAFVLSLLLVGCKSLPVSITIPTTHIPTNIVVQGTNIIFQRNATRMSLPDGTYAPIVKAALVQARLDTNYSRTVFPPGYAQKKARTNSTVVAMQTFPSGLVMVTRIFTNETGNPTVFKPRASLNVVIPPAQPYAWQDYWVPADQFQPQPTFNSDWQGFVAGTYQFQVASDLKSWRSLGQFTLTDPVDSSLSEGFDCPIGEPQNFLPLLGGFVRVIKTQ